VYIGPGRDKATLTDEGIPIDQDAGRGCRRTSANRQRWAAR
jgi:hypothetical protein